MIARDRKWLYYNTICTTSQIRVLQSALGDGGVAVVSIRFLSPLKCFFQLSIMFIPFKSGTRRSFISFVLMYFL